MEYQELSFYISVGNTKKTIYGFKTKQGVWYAFVLSRLFDSSKLFYYSSCSLSSVQLYVTLLLSVSFPLQQSLIQFPFISLPLSLYLSLSRFLSLSLSLSLSLFSVVLYLNLSVFFHLYLLIFISMFVYVALYLTLSFSLSVFLSIHASVALAWSGSFNFFFTFSCISSTQGPKIIEIERGRHKQRYKERNQENG